MRDLLKNLVPQSTCVSGKNVQNYAQKMLDFKFAWKTGNTTNFCIPDPYPRVNKIPNPGSRSPQRIKVF